MRNSKSNSKNNLQGFFMLFSMLALLMVSACATEGEESNDNAPSQTMEEQPMQQEQQGQSMQQDQQMETQTQSANQQNAPGQVTDEDGEVVYHYVCPNACEGSGGPGQATCPVCGSQYEHNQEYHQYQQANTTQPQSGNDPAIQMQQQQQQASGPNAQGEFHFICPEGCEGGSASKTTCENCGADLVHNDDFH